MAPDNDNIFLKNEIFEAKCEFPYDVNFFKEHVYKTTSTSFCSNIDYSLKWNLVIMPNSYDSSTLGSFCILLKSNNEKNDDINVLCQFYILDVNRKILYDDLLINVMFDKLKNMWGLKTRMNKDEVLKECVKDNKNADVFFVGCKVYYYYNKISDNKNNSLSNSLCVLLNTEKFSDCILKCGEKEFKVHKSILSCRSNILNKKLTDMKDEGISRIEIDSYSVDSVRNMLRYIYTNEVDNIEKNPIELLKMSHEYEIKGLKEILQRYLISTMSDTNFFDYAVIANTYNTNLLKQWCIRYFYFKAKQLMNCNEWKVFMESNGLFISDLFLFAAQNF